MRNVNQSTIIKEANYKIRQPIKNTDSVQKSKVTFTDTTHFLSSHALPRIDILNKNIKKTEWLKKNHSVHFNGKECKIACGCHLENFQSESL